MTGKGYGPLNNAIRGDMITVFIPSSPTAVAGYVVVAHREQVVELPLTVEEALRLLISGGVLTPNVTSPAFAGPGVPIGSPSAAAALPEVVTVVPGGTILAGQPAQAPVDVGGPRVERAERVEPRGGLTSPG